MAIQNRRGVYSDFTPSKMVPGELAVVQGGDPDTTSGQSIYAAFLAGQIKRLATEEDLDNVDTELAKKVDKTTGKGLSTNDYTTEEKNKLSGIEAQANKTVIDATLTQQGKAADAKAVGDAIAGVTIETDKTLSVTDAPADAKVVGDELSDVKSDLSEKAPAIISSVSGSIAHFEDGSDANAKSVIAHIEPVQDLHGYDSPWPAGGGVNKANLTGATSLSAYNLTTSFDTENEIITISGTVNATNTYVQYRFAVFPNIQNGLGLKAFNIPASASVYVDSLNWGGSTQQMVIIIRGLTAGETNTLNVKFQMVCYEGSTEPTAWTPYSNICPISGFTGMNVVRTGKNIWDEEWELGSISEVDGKNVASSTQTRSKNYVSVLPATAYYFKMPTGINTRVFLYDRNKLLVRHVDISNIVLTTGGSEAFLRFRTFNAYGTTYNHDISINYPSTDHDYHAYTGQTYPITFPSEAGTVYGGYVDLTEGKLVVDRAMVDLGTLNWTYYSQFPRFAVSLPSAKTPSANTVVANLRCSNYKAVTSNSTASAEGDFGIAISTSGNLQIRDTRYTDAATFKTAMSDVQLVYELATPITYDITPQQIGLLLGVNNVWNDCNGSTDVEYKADTKLYIEQLTKPTEDDMVANTAIASGKFFMVGNRLFISTTTIASGDTINPETNCTELSLADALNSL